MVDIQSLESKQSGLLQQDCRATADNRIQTLLPSHQLPFYKTQDSFDFVLNDWASDHSLSLFPHTNEHTFLHQLDNTNPPVVVVGVDQSLLENKLLNRVATSKNRPIIVSVINSADEDLLTECYQQGADRVIAAPFCSAKIFRALIKTLVTRDHHYPPFQISAMIQTIRFGNTQIRLRKRPFDLAQYLFMNHGQLIPRSKILHDLWGLDGQRCSTRRIDVHVCHIRRLLRLDGSHGWEIRTGRQSGYGLFQTSFR